MHAAEQADFSQFPLRIGSPLRVAHFAWPVWNISWRDEHDFACLVQRSEEAYSREWRGTTEEHYSIIARAAQAAGLSDANRRLNERVATVACNLVDPLSPGPIRILDIGAGAGATTLALWDILGHAVRRDLRCVLLDPAENALREAKAALQKAGMTSPQFDLVPQPDTEALPRWRDRFDLILSTAALHHHGYLEPVFASLAQALKPGGFQIIGDWFNGLSLHPARVFALLDKLEWPTKERDLAMFEDRFPAVQDGPPHETEAADQRADQHIAAFWESYARIQRSNTDGFVVLEGHRRVRHYIAALEKAGLEVPTQTPHAGSGNPSFLIPGSTLLGVVIAAKP